MKRKCTVEIAQSNMFGEYVTCHMTRGEADKHKCCTFS